MIRILGYLIAVAALVGGAVWMADHPGGVTVHWLSWRLDTTVPVLAFAVLLLAAAATVLMRFVGGFLSLPGRFARRSREKRQVKGTAALAGAVTALAGGEAEAARRCLKDADKALANPQLAHLIAAQIETEKGDAAAARPHYEALLETPETELAGLRGLLAAMPASDPRALDLASRAFARAPGAAWAARALYAAQIEAGLLDAAQETLAKARKKGGFDASLAAEESARLTLSRAEAARAEGRLSDAAKLAREALDAAPDSTAAALALAQIHAVENRGKKAAEVIAKQWARTPSPKLLAAWLDLWREEDAAQQVKRVRELVSANPDHPESRLALAEACLRAEAFADAHAALAPILGPDATAKTAGRAALTMARVLAAEGADPGTQREWIERAAAALAAG
ncbi:MAG: heme biosynthesis HemY N-terminal domain-containing protein [Rhodospirillaceae bacterium]